MKQKYNPFADKDRTVCGDCGKQLSYGGVRTADSIMEDGVRCTSCYNKFKKNLQWKKAKDDRNNDVLQAKTGHMIMLPIKFEGIAKKDDVQDAIRIRQYRQKSPDLTIIFNRYADYGNVKIKNGEALDGKKIRVTIEVLDGEN